MFEKFIGFFSKPKTGSIAKDRLSLLLSIDRKTTSPIPESILEKLKEELILVINKHLDVELDGLDMKIDRATDENGRVISSLVANIPISGSVKNK